MEMGEFHWTDGWYFKRMDDGAVRVRHYDPSGHMDTIAITIPPNEWASIIAHVGATGGTAEGYAAADALHTTR
jgi:hypothetical protein